MPTHSDNGTRAESRTDRRHTTPRRSKRDDPFRPRDLGELRLRLKRWTSRDAGKLASVAAFALAHPYDVAFASATRIANQCGVSVSPVFRLASRLGFEGYRDMKEFLGSQLRDAPSPQRKPTDHRSLRDL
jgi:DNA-binding MurR/RpiR family transcriptional regulator